MMRMTFWLPSPWFLPMVCLLAAIILPLASSEIDVPGDEWVSCQYYKEMESLGNCLCQVTEDEAHFRVNCDHVVFAQEFAPIPNRQPIKHFSHRFSSIQTVPPQAMLASGIPLQELDLSHSKIRRLNEKAFEGISENLEILNLEYNQLGDQLNPIFSTSEFKRLPRLKTLILGHNELTQLDGGILEGALSLQEVHLDNNQLRKVPALPGPNALKILNLSFNKIADLSSDDLSIQRSLILLNVSHNSISMSQSNAFLGMTNLRIIDLSFNRINRLNSDSFQGLTTVEAIDLSYNFMTEIPVSALKSLTTLRGLKMGGNLIQSLREAMTVGVWGSNMQVLDLSRNRISEIPLGFFSGMSKLKEINLGVNQLRTIPAVAFLGLPELRKLNLMDNNLLTFPSAALDPLKSLTSLTLDYNRISALVHMEIHNLTKLSLSNNLIREIPTDAFSTFPHLSHLNMYGNLIEKLDEVDFPPSIKYLNLGLNSLKSCPRFQLPGLESLNLQKNSLTTLVEHNFVLLGELKELDLSSNLITTFFPNTFDGLDSLEILNMASNNIEILPKFGNLEMLKELNFSKNNVKEIMAMENMDSLRILDLSSNSITNLPTELFNNTNNLEIINLQNNELTSFKGFDGSFERLKVLNLAKNQLTYVYPNSFDNFQELWSLNLNKNQFSFFPTEFLKNCKQLRVIDLAKNQVKSLHEMNFSNFPHLRQLKLNENFIEFIPHNSFLNSSQLQALDLSANKLESLDGNMFHGLYRLELDLSNNYLATLPPAIFDKNHVKRLEKLCLNKNTFSAIPTEALQKQDTHLDQLDLSENQIREIASNLNTLVNIKTLDLSKNPLSENALKNVLNEPKTVRHLSLAETGLEEIPILEMPFLRSLNLSGNSIKGFTSDIFQRTTLLKKLTLDRNKIVNLNSNFPQSLTFLDISSNPLKILNGKLNLPESLETLKLNDLSEVMKIEKSSLNLKNLITLEMYDLPKLGYLDIRGLLTNLQFLENFDFEVKDTQIIDQIHPGINARVQNIGLRGRQIRSISTGAFAGLTSPSVRISLFNTSLTLLPSILVPVPMSTNVILDLKGSKITNLSPPFLSQNIRLEGLNPTCDCNAIHLVKYLKNVESNAMCASPKTISVMDIPMDQLLCEVGTVPTTLPPRQSTTTPSPLTETPEDDIIWSLAPKTPKKTKKQDKIDSSPSSKRPKAQDINNMDNLIISIVGGVVGLIILFLFMIVCFVKVTSRGSSSHNIQEEYPTSPSVISVGPGGYAQSTKSKCTCPHSHSSGVKGPVYMPTLYSTVRSGGGHDGNGKVMMQGGGGFQNLASFGEPMYGSYLAGPPMSPPSNYNFNSNSNNYGHNSLKNQQQMYGSSPYFVQDERERR